MRVKLRIRVTRCSGHHSRCACRLPRHSPSPIPSLKGAGLAVCLTQSPAAGAGANHRSIVLGGPLVGPSKDGLRVPLPRSLRWYSNYSVVRIPPRDDISACHSLQSAARRHGHTCNDAPFRGPETETHPCDGASRGHDFPSWKRCPETASGLGAPACSAVRQLPLLLPPYTHHDRQSWTPDGG